MYPNPPFRGGRPDGVLVYHHGGPGALGWTIFALQLVVVLGIAWLLASLLLGRLVRRPALAAAPATGSTGGPLETLHMRYARGEIDRDAYLQARSDLGGEPEHPSEQPTQI